MREVPKGSPLHEAAKDFIHSVWKSRDRNTFPGSHPISIERRHFGILNGRKYVVCEKTDGTRYMMVCFIYDGRKYSLFVNRNMSMYQVSLSVPKDTILDGELVKVSNGDLAYMVFDGNMVNGNDIQNLNYLERLRMTETATRGPVMPNGIRVVNKTMWPVSSIAHLETLKFPYETDGYIFTPVDEPVRMETHETMFKWKPLHKITVDFKVRIVNGRYELYVWDRGSYVYESDLVGGFPNYDGKIVECKFDGNTWSPVKIRDDKPQPNNRRTFFRTMVNIRENIQPEDFMKIDTYIPDR